ncbi:MAG: GyrI-like domain-containing protein [Candidatus Saccharicenans sp.]|uniref:GyrI-like domain-containing protein n=1 Tax=Candidatus Saccharicenans sp. TaxID=2819258 RepID=UPI004049656D
MKERKLNFFIFVFILMFVLSLNFMQANSPSKLQPLPQLGQVEIRTVEPFAYCCLRREGSFSELEVVIGELMQNMQIQNILPAGPMIGVYYGDPELTDPEKMRWEIGFPISEQIQVLAPLEKKVWSYTTVAVSVHQGPYDKAGETILKMQEWLEANGYDQSGPILERYLDPDPARVSASGLKTEIWIACRKR